MAPSPTRVSWVWIGAGVAALLVLAVLGGVLIGGMGRKIIIMFAVERVSHADLDLFEPVENVELGQRDAGDPADGGGLAHKHGIEPTATPLPPCHDSEFMAASAKELTNFIVLLRRERSRADPRRIGFDNTKHEPDAVWPEAGTTGGCAGDRV